MTIESKLPKYSSLEEAAKQPVTIEDLFPKAGSKNLGRRVEIVSQGFYTLHYRLEDDGSFSSYSAVYDHK